MRDKVKFSALVSSALLAAALTGCGGSQQPVQNDSTLTESTSTMESTTEMTATDTDPITDPATYKDSYPNEYNSYISASAADFTNPLHTGKPTAVADLENGPNEPQAYCLNCHSTDMQLLMPTYPELASGAYVDARSQISDQSITCYTCHENTPGVMAVGSAATKMALETAGIPTDTVDASCSQCHGIVDHQAMESDPEIATWSTLTAGTNPEDVWALFQSRGVDNPDVAQNQYNIFQGSTHDTMGATCADCHMETITADDGSEYKNHVWQTVEENPNIYDNCATCHKDSAQDREAALKEVQEDFTSDTQAVQDKIYMLSEMLDATTVDESTRDAALSLLNESTFYLNYTTDNSMGFHGIGNNGMVNTCLTLATQKADDGIALLS